MTEFLHEKREMFMLQLMIDRQRNEIYKLKHSMEASETALIEEEGNISVTAKEYKTYEVELEVQLSRALRLAESASQKRVDLQTRLKRATTRVVGTKSEIAKNQDLLEDFRQFASFLQNLTSETFSESEFFESPVNMVECIDHLEKQNLMLIQTYRHFAEKVERDDKQIEDATEKSEADIQRFGQIIRDLPPPAPEGPMLAQGTIDHSHQLDDEYEALCERIKACYRSCFHRDSSMSVLAILMSFERELEKFYNKLEVIDPEFVAEKRRAQEKRRREQHRIRKQERQEHEQLMKMEHALARATRPIQKKTGRPLVPRALPRTSQGGVDYTQIAAMKEQQRIDELLSSEIV
jgi:hypothetical protein